MFKAMVEPTWDKMHTPVMNFVLLNKFELTANNENGGSLEEIQTSIYSRLPFLSGHSS